LAEARKQAAKIRAEADAFAITTVSNAQQTNASKVAQAVSMEGEAEAKMLKGFKARRIHEENMEKLGAMAAMATNKDTVLLGDSGNNLMAGIEGYKMVFPENNQ